MKQNKIIESHVYICYDDYMNSNQKQANILMNKLATQSLIEFEKFFLYNFLSSKTDLNDQEKEIKVQLESDYSLCF